MAFDLRNFSVTIDGSTVNANIPSATVSFKVFDTTTGQQLKDFTGANTVSFPQMVAALSAAEKKALLEHIIQWIVAKKLE